ncbi:hypothetical protein [Aestuariimicrobium sp. T2.26MG-19.2B]|uniref:hypothetical protein n=1 Tax=Aestuariimicrobium sp. T2.26MG-19.2B TaxID=3040679 RepID=UPI00247776AC|nr:hypothetical protein [Aestuariimicrobium sp. T2.26MG-19.2B]CAI9401357.1 hypothetical protein AESSP_00576 [Aestuariimicrobium sp. T2.26MG-19.2B]
MSRVDVRRDAKGTPLANVTVLLDRSPAPHEAIGELVRSATVTLELVCPLDRLSWVRFTLVDLARPDGWASVEANGPFGAAALQGTLSGDQARLLLAGLSGATDGQPGPDDPLLRIEARRVDGLTRSWRVPLATVLAPVVSERTDIVHLVAVNGAGWEQVFRPTQVSRRRAFDLELPIMRRMGGAMVPLQVAVAPIRPPAIATAIEPAQTRVTPIEIATRLRYDPGLMMIPIQPVETGPVLDGSPLMTDRGDGTRWYLPEVTLVAPAPGVDAETSPFRFDLQTVGHQADGTPGLEATITLTIAAGPSAATTAAWEAAGQPAMKPIPCAVQAGLSIPFRDETSANQVDVVSATSVALPANFGEAGSTATLTFAVSDSWARLAYGALSTPGFQPNPAQLQITLAHSGWRADPRLTRIPSLAERHQIMLDRIHDRIDRGMGVNWSAMAKARLQIRPPLQVVDDPDFTTVTVASYTWIQTAATTNLPALFPCADDGQLYRQSGTDGWQAIGCQPALSLGQAEYRTWQRETVTSVAGVQVFRSLTQPGRYLLLPNTYDVGRHRLDDTEEPLAPTLLLSTVLDTENPTNIRCVLVAALESPVTTAQRARLAAELSARAGRPVELVNPWDAGLVPTISWAVPLNMTVASMPIATGFTLLLTTDIPGVLLLQSILTASSLMGSASYTLPGGDHPQCTLRLALNQVVGPPDGPISVSRSGDQLTLTNKAGRRVSVASVLVAGQPVATPATTIDPQGSSVVDLPAGTGSDLALDWQLEPGSEALDEDRSYIDDLNLGLSFIATGNLTDIVGLEVATELLGHQPAPVELSAAHPQGDVQFVLPLTVYAADPVLHYTVTTIATDGSRTSAPPVDWHVHSDGALIAIPHP